MRPQIFTLMVTALALVGCVQTGDPEHQSAAQHKKEVATDTQNELTVGRVQRKVEKGMSKGDVAAAIGSPNIVTTDEDGTETWVYDKISTQKTYSKSSQSEQSSVSGGTGAGAILGAVGVLGGVGASQSSGTSETSGATEQTQKTLTVVIKYDENGHVKRVRYQKSSF